MVGILDSGIGGFQLLNFLYRKMDVAYFSDASCFPYGNKSEQEILSSIEKGFAWFQEQGVSNVIIACNTASFVFKKLLADKSYSFNVIGINDFTMLYTNIKHLTVVCTHYSKTHLEAYYNDVITLPELACMVEKREFDEILLYINQKIHKPKKILYACTHFPLVDNLFLQVFPDVEVYNPVEKIFPLFYGFKAEIAGNIKFYDQVNLNKFNEYSLFAN